MPQYQGVWNLQNAAQLQSTQRWVTDPLFDYNTLLLQADSDVTATQNNTFLDSSSNSFAITRNGNTTQGSFTPFSQAPGYWGNYFDGTGDYITAAGANLALGTGNFTIEFWFYANAYSSAVDSAFMFDSRSGNNTSGFFIGPVFNNTQTLHVGQNTSPIITANTTYPLNTWVHCAVVRSSGTITLYQNGVNVGSVANTTNNTATTNYIGSGWWLPSGAGQMFNGYLSNLRISNTARYTANFNPAANVFVSDGNTVLLTCQSNRFVDGSSNGYTITVGGGTPSVQAFSPFAPQYQWTPSVIGGSGYFDGTGDYLVTPTSSNLSLATNTSNFSFECWVYNNGFSGSQFGRGIFIYYPSGSYASTRLMVRLSNTSNKVNIYLVQAGNVQFGVSGTESTGVCTPSAWTHVAFIRNSNLFYLYLNGVLDTTLTASFQPQDLAFNTYSVIEVGRTQDGSTPDFNGYISGFRFVRNSAVYTTNFTLPTTPPTAITNTALLLNFTNAGIYDGTMKNNLETVGNAQVSTAVVKYGSGSMFFDGTGDNLIAPFSQNLQLGTGDFTIEFWINASASGSFNQVVGTLVSGTEAGTWRVGNRYNSTNAMYFARGTGAGFDEAIYGNVNVNDGLWHHVACVRIAGVISMYVDGVARTVTSGTASISGTCSSSNAFYVGYNGRDNSYVTGYLDDVRITRGIARYTQNFIPPSVALPRQ